MSGIEEYTRTATYAYVDEQGALLYERACFQRRGPDRRGRRFRERRTPDEDWATSPEFLVGEVRRVPYRLPELVAGVAAGVTVFVCKGERDVETMRARGFVATTTFAQPGTWADDEVPFFVGARVVVLPDNDDQGRNYANLLTTVLRPVATAVAVVELPGLAEGEDVSDWYDKGGSQQLLLALLPGG